MSGVIQRDEKPGRPDFLDARIKFHNILSFQPPGIARFGEPARRRNWGKLPRLYGIVEAIPSHNYHCLSIARLAGQENTILGWLQCTQSGEHLY